MALDDDLGWLTEVSVMLRNRGSMSAALHASANATVEPVGNLMANLSGSAALSVSPFQVSGQGTVTNPSVELLVSASVEVIGDHEDGELIHVVGPHSWQP